MLQDQMGGAVVEQASKFLGESSANTTSGIGALLPALMGGIIGQASTESGASGLLDMITKGNHDGGIMDSMGSMFGGGSSTSNLMNAGSLLTSSLFGGSKLGSVLDAVTSATGMRRSSSSSLMNLLAPVVMGMIGKQVKSGGLNASSLMNMLMGQKEHVAAALPAGMGSILGLADMSNMTEKVTSTVSGAATRTASAAKDTVREAASVTADVAQTGGSWMRWALPLVALVAIGGFLWNYMGAAADKATSMAGDAASKVTGAAGTMADGATKTINAAGDAVGNAANAAGTMASGAKDAAGNMVDGAKNAAGTMADGAKSAAGSMADGAKNAAGSMADGAKNAAGSMADGAKNAGGKMMDGAKHTGGKMMDGAKDASGKMMDGAKGTLGGKIKNATGKTIDATGTAATAAGGSLSAAGMAAKEKFSGMFKTGSSASAFSLHDITWDPTGNKITNYNKDEIMALASALKEDPTAKIQVQAFGKNKLIASGRAQVVKQILTTLGVKGSQLSAKGLTDGADENGVNVIVK